MVFIGQSIMYATYLLTLLITVTEAMLITARKHRQEWFIGRVPPTRFEYSKLNGFYTPKKALELCEKDLQCGGFTFKGAKTILTNKVEIYFFHIIKQDSASLALYKRYPQWSTYIVSYRDYVVLVGKYAVESEKCDIFRSS